ncbi:hypothetical protein WR25_17386 [Diploscapter pachys]|uniref:Uncharacterized protein n=1 Tax=Diploscapter pachys TaxID=2018661 RepID=A0A2A2JDV1_9BILA|nr:hypothetical protein WR25_17386 [Diploscapter pachys]
MARFMSASSPMRWLPSKANADAEDDVLGKSIESYREFKDALSNQPPILQQAHKRLLQTCSILSTIGADHHNRGLVLGIVYKESADLVCLRNEQPNRAIALYGMCHAILEKTTKFGDPSLAAFVVHLKLQCAIAMSGILQAAEESHANGTGPSSAEILKSLRNLWSEDQLGELLADAVIPSRDNLQLLHSAVFKEGVLLINNTLPDIDLIVLKINGYFRELRSTMDSSTIFQSLIALALTSPKHADLSVLNDFFSRLPQTPAGDDKHLTLLDVKLFIWTCAAWSKWRAEPEERWPRACVCLPLTSVKQCQHWKTIVLTAQGSTTSLQDRFRVLCVIETVRVDASTLNPSVCPELNVLFDVYLNFARHHPEIRDMYKEIIQHILKFGQRKVSLEVAKTQIAPALTRRFGDENDIANIVKYLQEEREAESRKEVKPVDVKQEIPDEGYEGKSSFQSSTPSRQLVTRSTSVSGLPSPKLNSDKKAIQLGNHVFEESYFQLSMEPGKIANSSETSMDSQIGITARDEEVAVSPQLDFNNSIQKEVKEEPIDEEQFLTAYVDGIAESSLQSLNEKFGPAHKFFTVEQLASQSLEEFIEAEEAIITFYAKIGAEDNVGGRPARHSTPTVGSAMQGQKQGQGQSMQMQRGDTDTDRMIERMEQLVREDLFNNKPPATLAKGAPSIPLSKMVPLKFVPKQFLKFREQEGYSSVGGNSEESCGSGAG